MTKSEIKVNELIAQAIDKIIEKYQKKADKEKEKARQSYITYKGEKYYTERDIMEAYACDGFSSTTCDRLLERLNKAKNGISENEMTESEIIVFELAQHKNNLLHEIAADKQQKERQAHIDDRMRELVAEGYSIREAQTIVGNEELMRYE